MTVRTGDPALARRGARLASGLRWRGGESFEKQNGHHRTRSEKEHAMMFAFALAIVGIAVLKTLELAAARAR